MPVYLLVCPKVLIFAVNSKNKRYEEDPFIGITFSCVILVQRQKNARGNDVV